MTDYPPTAPFCDVHPNRAAYAYSPTDMLNNCRGCWFGEPDPKPAPTNPNVTNTPPPATPSIDAVRAVFVRMKETLSYVDPLLTLLPDELGTSKEARRRVRDMMEELDGWLL